jgi:hypothetical protein
MHMQTWVHHRFRVISLQHVEFVERHWGGATCLAAVDLKKHISEPLIEFMDRGDSFERVGVNLS